MKHLSAIILVCTHFFTLYGQTPSTFEKKGDASMFTYDYEKAITYYAASDLTENGLRNYALALLKTNQLLDAEAKYALLITTYNNQHSDDYYNYARILRTNGKQQEFREWMDKFAENNPNDLRVLSYQTNKDNPILPNDHFQNIVQQTKNTTVHEFGAAFLGNDYVYVINKKAGFLVKRSDNRTQQTYLTLASLTNMKSATFSKNKHNIGPASFNKEGTFMALTLNHRKDKHADKVVELQIIFYTLTAKGWTNAGEFPYNNADYSVGHPALSENGNTMYFVSDMAGGFGGTDIYVTYQTAKNTWSKPLNLGNKINTEGNEVFPFFDEQNKQLYFSSNGHFGLGGLDVFCAIDDEVRNLSMPINSKFDDFAFIIDSEKNTGYFSSNRNEVYLTDAIYSFDKHDSLEILKRIEGLATTTNNELLENVFVQLMGEDSVVLQTATTTKNGKYTFSAIRENSYWLKGTKDNYVSGTNTIKVSGVDSVFNCDVFLFQTLNEATAVKVEIIRFDKSDSLQLLPIYFDFNDFSIRADAVENLDNIIALMNKYPKLEIQLKSYTDCRGTRVYNQYLSEKRAESSVAYIQAKINNPSRISGNGYGENSPVNGCVCEDDVKSTCSELAHQKNRRTAFFVIDK